jgi:hypothetical protein
MSLREISWGIYTGFIWLRMQTSDINEASGSIKFWEFLQWLNNCWLLAKSSAPRGWLISTYGDPSRGCTSWLDNPQSIRSRTMVTLCAWQFTLSYHMVSLRKNRSHAFNIYRIAQTILTRRGTRAGYSTRPAQRSALYWQPLRQNRNLRHSLISMLKLRVRRAL